MDGLVVSGLYGGFAVRFSPDLLAAEIAATNLIGAMPLRFVKPVVVHNLYSALHADQRPLPILGMRRAGIPVHSSLELAVRCIQALAERGEVGSARPCSKVLPGRARFGGDNPKALAEDEKEAEEAFLSLGAKPIAMKIVSPDILHKTEAGGVKLDVADVASVQRGFLEILANAKAAVNSANVAGVLITPMAAKGVEVVVGVVRDPAYGPLVMFGLGGILVEVLRDVVFRALPISRKDAFAMLDEIKAQAILDGVRGGSPVDRDALVDLIMSISDFVEASPEIEELDLNPVLAYPDGLAVLDVRIILTASSKARSNEKQGLRHDQFSETPRVGIRGSCPSRYTRAQPQ